MSKKTERKSIKLSNYVREKIVKELLDNAFSKELESFKNKRFKFSEKVYSDIYSKKERELMESLPEKWLPEGDTYCVQFGGTSSDVCKRQLKEKKRFAYKHYSRGYSSNVIKVYDYQHKLTKEHDEITDQEEDINSRYRAAQAQAEAIVGASNTTRQLKAAWPKISGVVEKFEPTDSNETTAIALVPDEVNKLFNL